MFENEHEENTLTIEEEGKSSESESQVEPDAVEEESSSDPVEELAAEFGWKKEGSKSAKDFMLERRDIQRKIRDDLKRNNRTLKESFKKLSNEFLEFRKEMQNSKAGSELEILHKQHEEATEEGDTKKAREILEKIVEVELKTRVEKKKPHENDKQELETEFSKWRTKNTWYKEDAEKTKFVDRKFDKLVEEYGKQYPPNEYPEFYFEEIDEALETEYKPSKTDAKKIIPSKDVGNQRPSNGKIKASFSDIRDPEIRKMAIYSQEKGALAHLGKTRQEQLDGFARQLKKDGAI